MRRKLLVPSIVTSNTDFKSLARFNDYINELQSFVYGFLSGKVENTFL